VGQGISLAHDLAPFCCQLGNLVPKIRCISFPKSKRHYCVLDSSIDFINRRQRLRRSLNDRHPINENGELTLHSVLNLHFYAKIALEGSDDLLGVTSD